MKHVLSRRGALGGMAAGVGALTARGWLDVLSSTAQAQGARPLQGSLQFLSPARDRAVAALCDLIIPDTDTPGAKAARVNLFIDAVLAQSEPAVQARFTLGLDALEQASKKLSGAGFARAPAARQRELLTRLSDRVTALSPRLGIDSQGDGEVIVTRVLVLEGVPESERVLVEFFQAAKMLTLTGYYTSEIGRAALGIEFSHFFHAEFRGCDHSEHREEPARPRDGGWDR